MHLTITQNSALYLAQHKISKHRSALFRHLRAAGRNSPPIFDGRLSSAPPSYGDFIGTAVADRTRILKCAQRSDEEGQLDVPLRKV
jgi:hypothetical protein